jgi:hypothetical protein
MTSYPQTLTVKKLIKMGFFIIKILCISSSDDPNNTHTKNHIKDAVQSDLRMCTKEPSFYLQTVYLGFYFILCSCKA